MRYRSQVKGDFTIPCTRKGYARSNCTSTFNNVWTYNSYGGTQIVKEVWDVITPGFHAVQKCGGFLPLNPFIIQTLTTTRHIVSPAWDARWQVGTCKDQVQAYDEGTWAESRPRILTVPPPPDAVITAVVNGAVADSRTAAWDVLTDIAELRETMSLFRKTVSVVGQSADSAIRVALRVKAKGPLAVARAFASAWLQYRYGWMPVLYSLSDALKALGLSEHHWEEGRARQEISDTATNYQYDYTDDADRIFTETLVYTQSIRGWAASELTFQNAFGFDPLRTGYELLTFSFVLDWLIQVGTYLEAISPFAAGTTLGSCYSIKTEAEWNIRYSYQGKTSGGLYRNKSWDILLTTYKLVSYERYARAPSLPGWNPRINLPRMADALALILGLSDRVRTRLRI